MKGSGVQGKPVLVAGVDIGAATAKVVIWNGIEIIASCIIPTGPNVTQAAEVVTERALAKLGLSKNQLEYVISTGYGRRAVTFSNKVLTEIICHAAGVHLLMSRARTVIDIGGQDSKVIGLNSDGTVSNFVMNDKCAAGTGRFLEVMARVLDLEISEMGPLSLLSREPCGVSSTCTVFAESEMVSLRAEGRNREDILAGIHTAMAHRIAIMGQSVGFKEEVAFTGGVAKNMGMKRALECEIRLQILVPEEPQIIGALGAAILAKAELGKLHKTS